LDKYKAEEERFGVIIAGIITAGSKDRPWLLSGIQSWVGAVIRGFHDLQAYVVTIFPLPVTAASSINLTLAGGESGGQACI
jgi:hypothetical protein